MATYTTNLGLKKPAQNDKIRIADINNNMDDIDAAFGAVGETSVATQLGDIRGGMAIVATGNAHDAIAAGQFVYVMNHDTLDDGLYAADSALAANATLSSSNLTAVSGGGLNALNSNLTNITTLNQATYGTGNVVYRVGRLCFISCVTGSWYSTAANEPIRKGSVAGTEWVVPADCKPVNVVEIKEANIGKRITIDTDGNVTCNEALNGANLRFSGCWITADAMPT